MLFAVVRFYYVCFSPLRFLHLIPVVFLQGQGQKIFFLMPISSDSLVLISSMAVSCHYLPILCCQFVGRPIFSMPPSLDSLVLLLFTAFFFNAGIFRFIGVKFAQGIFFHATIFKSVGIHVFAGRFFATIFVFWY